MDKIGKDGEKGMSENKQYEDDYVALDLTSYRIYLENKEIILPESQCQIGNF